MRGLFRFKYPKLIILGITIILAYILFTNVFIIESLNAENNNYFIVFLAGMLFSFGFTTPFAVGYFVTVNPVNIALAAGIGGIGAYFSDLIIFKLIKFSFMDEFRRLEHTMPLKKVQTLFHIKLKNKLQIYILYIFAGIIIASPLPDEIGVSMLAGLTHIKTGVFTLVSILCNTIGIGIFLLI